MEYNVLQVADRLALDEATLWEVYETYFAEYADQAGRLAEALEQDDSAAAARCLHALKGMTANLGMNELTGLLAALEFEARSGRLETVRTELGYAVCLAADYDKKILGHYGRTAEHP